MGEIVYLDYDADTLYAEYNNRGKVANFADIIADFETRGDALRARLGDRAKLDLTYGPGPRDRFDLFLPDAENPPVFAFIHGGYWQWNDKEQFAFLAEPFVNAGIAFANVEYPLCPNVTFEELVNSVRRCFAHLWREAPDLGFDRDRFMVSGHSAGGHLTGVVMTTNWPEFAEGLPANLVQSAMPISGPFELEPLRYTPIADPLKLDDATAIKLSPLFAMPRTGADTVVALGGAEGREFHRQAEAFAERLRYHGTNSSILSVPAHNHFSVLYELASSDGALFKAAHGLLTR